MATKQKGPVFGNVVTANTSSLLSIQRIDPVYAEFTVTENELTEVQRHMQGGRLPVEVRLPDQPEAVMPGTLTFVDNAVQEGTGTVKLRATVPNRERRLWPGRFVNVRLILRQLPGAVLVPASAPQNSAKGLFVYVVKEDGTADLRPVTLGQRQGDLVIVAQGVKKRDYYYTSPLGNRLMDLTLGPLALAFVGATGREDLRTIRELRSLYGPEWPRAWVRQRGLDRWADRLTARWDERTVAENERSLACVG